MYEPTHWENGEIFFGYYSLGHNMTVTEQKRKRIELRNGLRQEIIEHIPVHCRRCKLVTGDAGLMRECTRKPLDIHPALTSYGLDAEITGERNAQKVDVAFGAGNVARLVERGTHR